MAAEAGEGAAVPKKNSDLKARTLSAIVMVAVAGTALLFGGWAWSAFVLAVTTGVLWEWSKLSRAIAASWWARLIWLVAGVAYVGLAAEMLLVLRVQDALSVLMPVLAVIATDIGAYFAGRTFGGPKIAPKISPSKTWSGLAGGAIGAGLAVAGVQAYALWRASKMLAQLQIQVPAQPMAINWLEVIVTGLLVAIIAQTGDFFESWMKRRAGVKDSGHLIPGHGGLFDRVDGLLAVLFVAGLVGAVGRF